VNEIGFIDIILTAVKSHLPHLHNYVELCYAEPSVPVMIIYVRRRCTARRSTRISAILLGNTIVVKLLSELNVWCIDDGTIGCIMSDILHHIRRPIIKAEGEMIGQTLNASKCELITSDHEVVLAVSNILPSVTHVAPRDAIVLGAPVGVDVIIDTVLHCSLQVERVLAPGRTFEKSRHTRRLVCSEKLF